MSPFAPLYDTMATTTQTVWWTQSGTNAALFPFAGVQWQTVTVDLSQREKNRIALARIPRPLVDPTRPILAVRTVDTLAPRTATHARRTRRRWARRRA